MCGIIAVKRFDGQAVDEALLLRMRDTMVHRGPDDAGHYADGPVGLGHRRLSIVDLSPTGHQPMCNEDGTVWLVFNGEIYNYVELRERLLARGHQFRSTTDSEVIIHLYEDLGDSCVDELNGMFGFVIWDSRKNRMLGARDRFGIKPFYYYVDDSQFVCASEIKAIVEDRAVPRAPDHRGIADYLFAGAPLDDRTFFAGVSQLKPGHILTIEGGTVRTHEYWDLSFRYGESRGAREIESHVTDLVDDAVRIHCRSDAPLGAHLSGGLDSSTVCGHASAHVSGLKTFSIRFDAEGEFYDETGFAEIVADAIGSRFIRKTASGAHLADLYPALIWHMDQPAAGGGDAGFSYYAAAQLASEHVKVALTGHGGDEVFGGYPAQFQTAFGRTDTFSSFPGETGPGISRLARLRRVLRAEGAAGALRRVTGRLARKPGPTSEELWVRLHCGAVPEKNLSLHRSFVDGLGGYSPLDAYLRPFTGAPTDTLLDRCLYHDLRVYLPQLLHKEDRASMSVSIESRVPLLDPRIAEYLGTLRPEQKVPEVEPKALLRRAAARHIPPEIWQRKDKVPFAIPMKTWMSTVLQPLFTSLLQAPQCLDRGIFDPDLIRSGRLTDSERLTMMNVELWFRIFIDEDPDLLASRDRLFATAARGA
jgi:asparagine synthase (glutamine-hydrolysing)